MNADTCQIEWHVAIKQYNNKSIVTLAPSQNLKFLNKTIKTFCIFVFSYLNNV